MDTKKLQGRLSLVTGSTSGIGFGIAETLATQGSDIVLHGFGTDDVIAKCRSAIESHQVKCLFHGADLSNVNEIREMMDSIKKTFSKTPDILVNNAGFQHKEKVTEFELEIWQKMLNVQLTAPFILTQQCLPNMIQNGWGRIINMSSVHGLVASPLKSAYVTVKHGLIGLTKSTALETGTTGVTCNAICPGWVETPLFVKQVEDIAKDQNTSYQDAKMSLVNNHVTGQPVPVQDIGDMVAYLCSPSANQITGASIVIDGGWIIR